MVYKINLLIGYWELCVLNCILEISTYGVVMGYRFLSLYSHLTKVSMEYLNI